MINPDAIPEIGEYARLDGQDVRVVTILNGNIVIVERVDNGAKQRCHPGDLDLIQRAVRDYKERRDAFNPDDDPGPDAPCAGSAAVPPDSNDDLGLAGSASALPASAPPFEACEPVPVALGLGAVTPNTDAGSTHGEALGLMSADTLPTGGEPTPESMAENLSDTAPGGVIALEAPDLPDLTMLDEVARQQLLSRWAHIKPLVKSGQTTKEAVKAVAAKAGVSPSTIWRWLNAYRRDNSPLGLVRAPGGPAKGETKLLPAVERIVAQVIDELYLSTKKHDIPYLHETIVTRCYNERLEPPSIATVYRRVGKVPPALAVAKRVSAHRAFEIYGPTPEEVSVSAPYELVQFDHTRADIIVVEETTREPIGRPWVTLGIDVFSRMPAAAYLSMNPPCSASVGLAIWRAMTDKSQYLRDLGLEGEWPVSGKIGAIKVDNGKDLKSRAVKLGCVAQGIDVKLRQVRKPADGAHIERLMGAVARLCARLPGATGHNTKAREGREPERTACLTLFEFEKLLVDFLVNVYPYKHHQGIDAKPILKWRTGVLQFGKTISTGPENPIADPVKARLDLMPFHTRTVQRYGIMIGRLRYWCDELAPLIKKRSDKSKKTLKKYVVRYDPRDMSEVIFYDDETNRHILVPIVRTELRGMSQWEHKALRRAKNREGDKIDTEAKVADNRRRSDAIIAAAATRKDRRLKAKHLTLRSEAEAARRERSAALPPNSVHRGGSTGFAAGRSFDPDTSAFDDFGDF